MSPRHEEYDNVNIGVGLHVHTRGYNMAHLCIWSSQSAREDSCAEKSPPFQIIFLLLVNQQQFVSID